MRPATVTTFGVSGFLIDSDVLLWDRESQSLWSQIGMRAIAGPRSGQRLEPVSVTDTTWDAWKTTHPDTEVLRPPGDPGRYTVAPYRRYLESDRLMFPVHERSDALPNKSIVSGVSVGGADLAWSHERLRAVAEARAEETRRDTLVRVESVGDAELRLTFDPAADSIIVEQPTDDGYELVPSHRMFWFAWFAFHPKTELRPDPPPDE